MLSEHACFRSQESPIFKKKCMTIHFTNVCDEKNKQKKQCLPCADDKIKCKSSESKVQWWKRQVFQNLNETAVASVDPGVRTLLLRFRTGGSHESRATHSNLSRSSLLPHHCHSSRWIVHPDGDVGHVLDRCKVSWPPPAGLIFLGHLGNKGKRGRWGKSCEKKKKSPCV